MIFWQRDIEDLNIYDCKTHVFHSHNLTRLLPLLIFSVQCVTQAGRKLLRYEKR